MREDLQPKILDMMLHWEHILKALSEPAARHAPVGRDLVQQPEITQAPISGAADKPPAQFIAAAPVPATQNASAPSIDHMQMSGQQDAPSQHDAPSRTHRHAQNPSSPTLRNPPPAAGKEAHLQIDEAAKQRQDGGLHDPGLSSPVQRLAQSGQALLIESGPARHAAIHILRALTSTLDSSDPIALLKLVTLLLIERPSASKWPPTLLSRSYNSRPS